MNLSHLQSQEVESNLVPVYAVLANDRIPRQIDQPLSADPKVGGNTDIHVKRVVQHDEGVQSQHAKQSCTRQPDECRKELDATR